MIRFENISKAFGTITAVDRVSFQVNRNECFGLIGPDGGGKTTLLRMLVTLLKPDSGSLTLDETDVVAGYRDIRNRVGYMPGRFSLYQDLTVEENLAFFASVFGTTIRENYAIIEPIYRQIEPFRKRRAGKLSGGMKQKLALSCALIHRPELLVLDEPTTGVDAVSRREFWEILSGLKEAGITIVVSTPYMDEASMCDRIALLQQGRILSIDTPGNMIKTHGKPIFQVKATERHSLISELSGWDRVASVYPFGQSLHVTPLDSSLGESDVRAFLRNKGYNDVWIERGTGGIEDIFMDLMVQQ